MKNNEQIHVFQQGPMKHKEQQMQAIYVQWINPLGRHQHLMIPPLLNHF